MKAGEYRGKSQIGTPYRLRSPLTSGDLDGLLLKYIHNTPALMSRNVEEYISGYVDGEGCFSVSFSRRSKMLVGWETKPSFSVSQNQDRAQVLSLIQKKFGCGFIRRDFSDKTLKYEVRSLNDLIGKVTPHFDRFPLLSSKQKDFLKFKEVCLMMGKDKHKYTVGLKQIMKIAFTMNPGGKRKYTHINILESLDEDIVSAPRNSGMEHEVPTRTNSVTTGQLSRRLAR